jgi:hypothetical protein
MKMEQWIRAIAGTFILVSVGLGWFYSKYWLLFTAFVGLNLLQSALRNGASWRRSSTSWVSQKNSGSDFRRVLSTVPHLFFTQIPLFPPFVKGDDRGRIPSGCATMSRSFLTGPPREADQGGKGVFYYKINLIYVNPLRGC